MNKIGGVLLVIGALGISGFRVMRSYDNATTGQSVRSDAQQMAEAAEDPKALSRLAPQSEVGKEVKPLLIKIADSESKLQKELDSHPLDEIFTAKYLADPKLRSQSLAHIDSQYRAYADYVKKVSGYRADIFEANRRHGYQKAGVFDEANGEDMKILRCQGELLDHYRKIIKFVATCKTELNGSKLVFADTSELETYHKLIAKGSALEDTVTRVADKVVKDKQERDDAYVAQLNRRY